MLREFARVFEAEIWKRVRRRYLTSFAGLHFENEPLLTELDAAECRRNRRLCLKGGNENGGNTSDVIGQAKNRLCKTGQYLADKRPGLRSLLSPRQAIAETGPTGQLHYDGMANGGHLFCPEDKDELDFSEPAMVFYPPKSPPE